MRPRIATLAFSVVLVMTSCVRPPAIPAPPQRVRAVAVLPPNNRTGDDLLVAGGSLLERYALHSPRVTVSDLLVDEARELLRARGYQVTAASIVETATGGRSPESVATAAQVATHAGLDGFALYLEIRRWEGDGGTHPAFVIVGVRATLIEAATGREVWSVHPPVHPVATPGTATLGTAYEIAARKVAVELLASWPTWSATAIEPPANARAARSVSAL